MSEQGEPFIPAELLEAPSIQMPSLSVNVDVVQLLETRTEQEAFELLGKLKDLLTS